MADEQEPNTPENAPEETPEDAAGEPETQPQASGDEAAAPEDAPSDEEAAALAAAMAAVSQLQGVADSASPKPGAGNDDGATPFNAPEFGMTPTGGSKQGIDLLSDVHMNVRIELGRTKMYVEDVLKLSDGAVVELDKLAGDPVDVFVNDRKVARGEVLVLNDLFCVRISEVVDITVSED